MIGRLNRQVLQQKGQTKAAAIGQAPPAQAQANKAIMSRSPVATPPSRSTQMQQAAQQQYYAGVTGRAPAPMQAAQNQFNQQRDRGMQVEQARMLQDQRQGAPQDQARLQQDRQAAMQQMRAQYTPQMSQQMPVNDLQRRQMMEEQRQAQMQAMLQQEQQGASQQFVADAYKQAAMRGGVPGQYGYRAAQSGVQNYGANRPAVPAATMQALRPKPQYQRY